MPRHHEIDYLNKLPETNHLYSIKVLARELGTDVKEGLPTSRAKRRLELEGFNVIKPVGPILRCKTLSQIFGPFTILILVAVLLCFVAYTVKSMQKHTWEDLDYVYYGALFLIIAAINSISFFYYSNSKNEAMKSFRVYWPRVAHVIRDGVRQVLPVSHVVRGDLVEIEAGKNLPADIRLVRANNMKVDNYVITGDKKPQKRSTKNTSSNLLKTENTAFLGSCCVEGYGRGIVVSTGNATVIGRFARLVTELDETILPPLEKEIDRFESLIFVFLVISISLGLLLSFTTKYELYDNFIIWAANIWGAIPEGLIPTIGVILVVMAKRIARKQCVVKNLMALDTLGLTSALCVGKTGILTRRYPDVSRLWMDGEIFEAQFPTTDSETPVYILRSSWLEFSTAANLCHSAYFIPKGNRPQDYLQRKYVGEEKDVAILIFMRKNTFDRMENEKSNTKLFETPFNSSVGYSVSIDEITYPNEDVKHIMIIKGTPEMLFDRSSTILLNGCTVEITEEIVEMFEEALNKLSSFPESVLGLCDYILPQENFSTKASIRADIPLPPEGLRFLGMMSFTEEPKEGVAAMVKRCRSAGIKVVLITGAHPSTARTIAEKSKIITLPECVDFMYEKDRISLLKVSEEKYRAAVVSGKVFDIMTFRDLEKLLDNHEEIVFARMSPHQKFFVVNALQRLGHTVAMTGNNFGDGVSIKKADIGIALGKCQSDVISESSDIILLDENFHSIVDGIEMGRLIYHNVKKALIFSMSVHLTETLPFFLNLWMSLPMPLLSTLCLNLGINIWPAIFIGLGKPEDDIMLRKPRPRHLDRLVTWKLIRRTYFQVGMLQISAAYFAYFIVMAENGFLLHKLLGSQSRWNSKAINDFEDSFGQEWTHRTRQDMENLGQSAFFVTAVVMQMINVFSCRTLSYSIFHRCLRNWYLNFSVAFSLLLAILLVYCPVINAFLHLYPVRLSIWFVGAPFALVLVVFEEVRRYCLRTLPPGSWIEQESYF